MMILFKRVSKLMWIVLWICSCSQKAPVLIIANVTFKPAISFINQPSPNDGKALYLRTCLSCHQIDGRGVPGTFPPLNKLWLNDKERLIKIVLQGLQGEIKVDDEIYNNTMPKVINLSDGQIAILLTFVRKNFGNNPIPVKVEEVTKMKKKLNTQVVK
jgi:mono/diheme cytochrome c family protein